MPVCKMLQASIGLLYLGHVLLGLASFGLDTCAAVIPTDTVVKIGEKAVIKCLLTSQNIAWTFCPRHAGGPYVIANNCNLVPFAIDNYRLDKNSNACSLIINNVTKDHFGTYTCQDLALNDHGHSVQLGYSNENMALRKPTIQSSTFATYISPMAVDGNSDSNWNHASCSTTEIRAPAWWAVDLGQEVPVGRVRITSRSDCCAERLQRFFIGLTNISPFITAPSLNQSSICKYYTGYPAGGIATDIFCEPNTQPGRYLFVYQIHAEYLSLCELEAYYQ